MNIEQTTASTINDLWTGVESQVENASYLEEAAQALTAAMHQEFGDSVVIARVFFTVPFDNLPPPPVTKRSSRTLLSLRGLRPSSRPPHRCYHSSARMAPRPSGMTAGNLRGTRAFPSSHQSLSAPFL